MNDIEIYQLFPHSGYLMHSYLIKTPSNKIVMIDGGNTRYMPDAYLPSAIRGVLGLGEGEYFEIEAWFISHGHDDHYGEFIMMMKEYEKESNYKVKEFYFDFPDFEKTELKDYSSESIEELKRSFDKYAEVNGISCKKRFFDELNGKVINQDSVKKGLVITIDGVNFEILQTWDESDDQVNGNSTVIRLTRADKTGRSCLFLNDASPASGKRLLDTYGDKLKSDIVQLAHHGQGGCNKDVYEAIDADLRLWPIPSWVWKKPQYKTPETRSWFNVDEENPGDSDFVACFYEKYPENHRSVEDWKNCVDAMKIVL